MRLENGKIRGAEEPLPEERSARWRQPFTFTTDEQGRFQVSKLPPRRVQLARVIELPGDQGSYLFPHLHTDIQAGKPTEVVFGGKGRPVAGQLVGLDS